MRTIIQKLGCKDCFWVAVLIIIGLIPRIYWFNLHQVMDYDGSYYSMLGQNLFSGAGYTEAEGTFQYYYPPLYPINIGFFWLMFDDIELSSKIASMISGTLIILFVYGIAKRIYGKETAIISGIFVALHPNLILFSSNDTAESLFTSILYLVIFITLYAFSSNKIRYFVMVGFLFGLLFLTKPAGIQYLAGYAIIFCITGLMLQWKKIDMFIKLSSSAVIFLILVIPYWAFLKNHYGHWTLSELKNMNIIRSELLFSGDIQHKVFKLNSDGTQLKYFTSDRYNGEHVSVAKLFMENPAKQAQRYLFNLKKEIWLLFDGIKIFILPILVFLPVHFLIRKWDKEKIVKELILCQAMFPLLTAPLISAHSPRWVLPMVPVLIIWFSHGIWILQGSLSRIKYSFVFKRKIFVVLVILFWICSVTSPAVFNLKVYAEMYPHEHKELGIWIKENLSLQASTVVMSASPHVAFYAGTKYKTMPWGEYPDVISYARYHNVEYLVIDETFIPDKRSPLAFLLDEQETPSDLKLVYYLTAQNGKKIIFYKIIKE